MNKILPKIHYQSETAELYRTDNYVTSKYLHVSLFLICKKSRIFMVLLLRYSATYWYQEINLFSLTRKNFELRFKQT